MARSFKDILKDLGIGVKSPEQIEREKDPVLAKTFKRQVPTPEDYKISKAYRARKAQEAIPKAPTLGVSGVPVHERPVDVEAFNRLKAQRSLESMRQPREDIRPDPGFKISPIVIPPQTKKEKRQEDTEVALDSLIQRQTDRGLFGSGVARKEEVVKRVGGMDIFSGNASGVLPVDITSIFDPIVSAMEKAGRLFQPEVHEWDGIESPVVTDEYISKRYKTPKSTGAFTTTEEAIVDYNRRKQAREARDLITPEVLDYNEAEMRRQAAQAELQRERLQQMDAMPPEPPAIIEEAPVEQPVIEVPTVDEWEGVSQQQSRIQDAETKLDSDVITNYWYENYTPKEGKSEVTYGDTASKNAKPFKGIVLHHDLANKSELRKLEYYGTYDAKRKPEPGYYGYHFAIDSKGNVFQTAPLTKRTNHIKQDNVNSKINKQFQSVYGDEKFKFGNSNTIGIAYLGTDRTKESMTEAAQRALVKLVNDLVKKYPEIDKNAIFAHSRITTGKTPTEGRQAERIIDNALNPVTSSRAIPLN
jgi:hypothetical protein